MRCVRGSAWYKDAAAEASKPVPVRVGEPMWASVDGSI